MRKLLAETLSFRQETVAEVADEAAALAREHWREVEAPLHGQRDYTPDRARYDSLERLGMLCITTARDGEGRLAGYAVLEGEVVAALDGLYLAPAARRGFNALALLQSAEAALAARGAGILQYSSPASRPCGALYRRLGATRTETVWHKRLPAGSGQAAQPGSAKRGGTPWQ